jgi:hypothetical protein
MTLGFFFALIIPIAIVWCILDWREKKRVTAGLPRHSALRLIFAAAAILTAVFSGGCGTILMIGWIMDGMRSSNYIGWEIVTILSLPPFLIGVLIWWLSMRRGNS